MGDVVEDQDASVMLLALETDDDLRYILETEFYDEEVLSGTTEDADLQSEKDDVDEVEGMTDDALTTLVSEDMSLDIQRCVKRVTREHDRLFRYGWRVDQTSARRYVYVHEDGETVTSKKQALRRIREKEEGEGEIV